MPPPPSQRQKHAHHSAARRGGGSAGSSVNALKKKIRDVERLLSKNTKLPATARLENERLLSAFKHELALAQRAQKEQKNFKKYHMVRFFERQKATRRLKKLNRELAAHDGQAPEDLRQKVHAAEVDLNYTLHYPTSEKYISLWPKVPGTDAKVDEKREAIKKDIERRMATGTLGARTIEREEDESGGWEHSEDDEGPSVRTSTKPARKGMAEKGAQKSLRGDKSAKRKRKDEDGQSADRIEDDDFFEF